MCGRMSGAQLSGVRSWAGSCLSRALEPELLVVHSSMLSHNVSEIARNFQCQAV